MKVVIIYDSLFGNTKKIAESIKSGFGDEFDTKIIHAKEAKSTDVENIDLLIIGSPTHAGSFTKAIKKFISSLSNSALENIKVCTFDTSIPSEGQGAFGKFIIKVFKNASPRLMKALVNKGGQEVSKEIFWVLDSEGPLMDGESVRAEKWTEEICETVRL